MILAALVAGPSAAEVVRLGRGSFSTSLPPGAKGPADSRGQPAEPAVSARVKGPVPTNDWWSSLVWKRNPDRPYSGPMFAHPLALRARAEGLEVAYPTHPTCTPDGRNYNYHFRPDLVVGVDGLDAPRAVVDGFGDWTVSALWEGGGRTFRATVGHGLPYVYCEAAGGDAVVQCRGQAEVWRRDGAAVGVTVNGHSYGLFAPAKSAWEGDGPFRAAVGRPGCFAVAVLPEATPTALDLFARHAFAFVTDTQVSWAYDEPSATLTTKFRAATRPRQGTERRPILALYRHQWLNLPGEASRPPAKAAAALTEYAYVSPRGVMKVMVGEALETRMAFGGVLPGLPDVGGCNAGRLAGYIEEAARNARPLGTRDTYWTGKSLGRLASLAHVADAAGNAAARDRFLDAIRGTLERWFTAGPDARPPCFAYDGTWGTLIGYPASYGSDTQLNDHHFHYGYFVMAAAALARFQPEWASDRQWGPMVRLLIHDVACPRRDDRRFPFLRTFDPYAGHSWAAGHAAFAAGNNQESSSEAMNFAAGVILYGAATGDVALRDLGIFLHANEARAVAQYWFDADEAVFPDGYRHHALGILWSSGGAYATWWTANPEEIHGINFLPVTGGSLYLGRRPEALARNLADMEATNNGPAREWRDLVRMARALVDPQAALEAVNADPDHKATSGLSKAHTYHWIGSLARLGAVRTDVTADSPTAAAFGQGGQARHVAWNPSRRERTVTFSDGARLTVPAGAVVSDAGGSGE
jgi:endoglucanase Acf2